MREKRYGKLKIWYVSNIIIWGFWVLMFVWIFWVWIPMPIIFWGFIICKRLLPRAHNIFRPQKLPLLNTNSLSPDMMCRRDNDMISIKNSNYRGQNISQATVILRYC